MTSPGDRPEGLDGPEERAWAELVRAFHATPESTDEHRWPAAEDLSPDDLPDEPSLPGPGNDSAPPIVGDEDDEAGDTISIPRQSRDDRFVPTDMSDRFVPPNPPPIPRGDRVSQLAWAGVLIPPAVVLIAGLASINVPTNIMAFLALAFMAGFGTLVYRMRGHHPSDPDDGAII